MTNVIMDSYAAPELFQPQTILLRKGEKKVIKKKSVIYQTGAMSDGLYYIASGRIKVSTTNNEGRELTKSIMTTGDIFGQLCIIGEKTRNDTAYTLNECTVYFIKKHDMMLLMRQHNAINNWVLDILGKRLMHMERRLESLVFKDSRTRIIDYLKDLANNTGRQVGFETVVDDFLTHREIANITATARQKVTAVLNELKNKNVIHIGRKKLLIRDFSKLV